MYGWVWDDGAYTSLPDTQGGNHSTPFAINESGLIAGRSYVNQSQQIAATWSNGQLSVLPGPDNSTESCAYDVNDAGQIVGFSHEAEETFRTASLWQDGNYYALSDQLLASGV